MEKKKYVRKIEITGTLVDAYKFYKKGHKKSVIDRKTYMDICHTFNKMISHKIITESMEFRVPYGLGSIRIKTTKSFVKVKDGKVVARKNGVDWGRTKEMYMQLYGTNNWDILNGIPNKKVVLYTNEHSNGYAMKWMWNKRYCKSNNKHVYNFTTVKGGITKDGYYSGRRGLAAWINNEERTNEYYL
jgi:hypothetical protein